MAAPSQTFVRAPTHQGVERSRPRFVCAWCEGERVLEMLERPLPEPEYPRVGICPSCLDARVRALSRKRPAAAKPGPPH